MRMYYVSIAGFNFKVLGCEAAYEAFRKACEFADVLGLRADLWDGETGEVLASSDDED